MSLNHLVKRALDLLDDADDRLAIICDQAGELVAEEDGLDISRELDRIEELVYQAWRRADKLAKRIENGEI